MSKTGIFGHNGSDGRSFTDRIYHRCVKSFGSAGENIGSEFNVDGRNHALQTVMGLIIDDGVESRGHRKNIFSTAFKFVGIASRIQGKKIITVMDYHSANLIQITDQTNIPNLGKGQKPSQKSLKTEKKSPNSVEKSPEVFHLPQIQNKNALQ